MSVDKQRIRAVEKLQELGYVFRDGQWVEDDTKLANPGSGNAHYVSPLNLGPGGINIVGQSADFVQEAYVKIANLDMMFKDHQVKMHGIALDYRSLGPLQSALSQSPTFMARNGPVIRAPVTYNWHGMPRELEIAGQNIVMVRT